MGNNNSTQQAQANQTYNQQAAEKFFQSMVNNQESRIAGLPGAPVGKWGPIQGPGQDMSRAWNPKLSPLAQHLSGWQGFGQGGGGRGSGGSGGGGSGKG